MAFHNFSRLIGMHKRSFTLLKKLPDVQNPITSRYEPGNYEAKTGCSGVFETVKRKDLEGLADGDLEIFSSMKLTTCPDFMNGNTLAIRDKIEYDGSKYFVHLIRDDTHYGNFIIALLKLEQGNV